MHHFSSSSTRGKGLCCLTLLSRCLLGNIVRKLMNSVYFHAKALNTDAQQVLLICNIVNTSMYSNVRSGRRRGDTHVFCFVSEGIYYRILYVNLFNDLFGSAKPVQIRCSVGVATTLYCTYTSVLPRKEKQEENELSIFFVLLQSIYYRKFHVNICTTT